MHEAAAEINQTNDTPQSLEQSAERTESMERHVYLSAAANESHPFLKFGTHRQWTSSWVNFSAVT